MNEINKIRLWLGVLAFVHINLIATGIVFAPFGFLNNIVIVGNGLFLMLNGLIMGVSFGFSHQKRKNNKQTQRKKTRRRHNSLKK